MDTFKIKHLKTYFFSLYSILTNECYKIITVMLNFRNILFLIQLVLFGLYRKTGESVIEY